MSLLALLFEVTKLALVIVAAGFTYYKFFREGTHKQRIEFDIECLDLGVIGDQRVVEIGCFAENKGNVEQRFEDIRVKVKGLGEGEELQMLKNHEPRLEFPTKLAEASLISENWKYFFVRPKVKQRFPLVISIPKADRLIWVRSTFKYQDTGKEKSEKATQEKEEGETRNKGDIHSAERVFQVGVG